MEVPRRRADLTCWRIASQLVFFPRRGRNPCGACWTATRRLLTSFHTTPTDGPDALYTARLSETRSPAADVYTSPRSTIDVCHLGLHYFARLLKVERHLLAERRGRLPSVHLFSFLHLSLPLPLFSVAYRQLSFVHVTVATRTE